MERWRQKDRCSSVTCVTADACRGVGSVPAYLREPAVGGHLPGDELCTGAGNVQLVKAARLQTVTKK